MDNVTLTYTGGNTHQCDNLDDAISTVRCDYAGAGVSDACYEGVLDGAHVATRRVTRDGQQVATITEYCTCPLGDHVRDAAVRSLSVFGSWTEMRADMQRTGYVPTIRTDDNAAPTQRHKDAALLVRNNCDAAGCRWSG